ncbi:MAG: hypothetical protein V4722_06860 [Bacteroidota bacterium]
MTTQTKMMIKLEEPQMLFNFGQTMNDPRDGLTLFGPLENNKPYGIRSGVISTKDGLRKFKSYLDSIQKPVFNNNSNTRPFFPGFEAVFGMPWKSSAITHLEITDIELGKVLYHEDVHTRTYDLVGLISDRLIKAKSDEDDGTADLWFIVMPDEVYQHCRPNSTIKPDLIVTKKTISKSTAKKFLAAPSFFDEINVAAEPFKYDADFHNQLKARLLPYAMPTQLVRESTLAPHEYLNGFGQPKRDFSKIAGHLAWTLSTAAFYKTGGRPWKLHNIRPGVCYLGLVYKQDERHSNPRNACCAAQMFLDSGDGIVFKGAVGPWYNPKRGDFHLKKKQAKELLEVALKSYISKEGSPPLELFIHAKTTFNDEEWEGFESAVTETTNLVGVTIKNNVPLKIYRADSRFPMLRGLAYIEDEKRAYLWTKGYVPRLETSLAMEVPNPLFIEISQGSCPIEIVLKDVFALTKLNYNACVYGDGEPVTLRFADIIGEVLTAAPLGETTPPLSFKYYI